MFDKQQQYFPTSVMFSAPYLSDMTISSESVASSVLFFQVQQTGKRVDTEICYVSASKVSWETLSKRGSPGSCLPVKL
jgi:hypothetical protein